MKRKRLPKKRIQSLVDFLRASSASQRERFAKDCGVSLGHLTNVAYGVLASSKGLALSIEANSQGRVKVEEVLPQENWSYLRSLSSVSQPAA